MIQGNYGWFYIHNASSVSQQMALITLSSSCQEPLLAYHDPVTLILWTATIEYSHNCLYFVCACARVCVFLFESLINDQNINVFFIFYNIRIAHCQANFSSFNARCQGLRIGLKILSYVSFYYDTVV